MLPCTVPCTGKVETAIGVPIFGYELGQGFGPIPSLKHVDCLCRLAEGTRLSGKLLKQE